MKRWRIWLATIIGLLVWGLMALPSHAGYTFAYGGNGWSGTGYVGDSSVQIDRISFIVEHGTVPSTYDGKPVTSLNDGAVQNSPELVSIVIPKSVTRIGKGVLAGCPNLEKITVEAGNPVYHSENNCIIETATNRVVAGCYSSKLPDSVTSIAAGAFKGCEKLVSLSLPDGLRGIGDGAFEGCIRLQSLAIPAATEWVGNGALAGCTQLNSLTVDADNSYYYSANNCLIERGSDLLIAAAKEVQIPDGVKGIGEGTFKGNTTLKKLVIPDSVKSIGASAFESCSGLERLEIGSGLSQLGYGAFNSCTALSVITVKANNPTYRAEGNCLILRAEKKIVLGCKDSEIPVGADVKIIGEGAFYNCPGLTSVTLSDTVETVELRAFNNCPNLAKLHIGKNVKSISERGFLSCGITKLTVDANNATYRGAGNCLIRKADGVLVLGCAGSVIPTDGSVKVIGSSAFYGCAELEEITIPASVEKVENYAFAECTNLKRVIINTEAVTAVMTNRSACGELIRHAEEVLVPLSFSWVGSGIVDQYPCSSAVKIDSVDYGSYRYRHSDKSVRKMSEDYHWYACATCDEMREEYGMELHRYAYDCADTCEVCSYQREAECCYEGEWYDNDKEHWKFCIYCYQTGLEGEHTPGAEATAQTPQVCTTCNRILVAAFDHDHFTSGGWKGDGQHHWMECGTCHMKMYENDHSPVEGEDGEMVCKVCDLPIDSDFQHIHTPSGIYLSDEEGHWNYCMECGEDTEKLPHNFGEGILTLAPTQHREGERTFVCADCNLVKIEKIPCPEQEEEEEEEETLPPVISRPIGGYREPSDSFPDSEPSTQGEGDSLPILLMGAAGVVIVIAAVAVLILKKKKK